MEAAWLQSAQPTRLRARNPKTKHKNDKIRNNETKIRSNSKTDPVDAPKEHEMSAAVILAHHFKADIIFLRPETKKTPDIDVNGTKWEIKSPKGNAKKTIDNNLRTARKQSRHIVLDLRRAKLHQSKAEARIRHYLVSGPHKIKSLKIITKTHKIIDIL